MISCPNKNTKAWKELERKYGDFAYILWDKHQGNIPLSLYGEYPAFSRDSSIIDKISRIVDISNNGYINTNGKPLPDYKLEQINKEIVRVNSSYRASYRLIRNKKGDYSLMNGNDFVYYNDSKDEFISINAGIAILDSFKKRFNVDYEIVNPNEAKGILENSPQPYTDESGFYYKGKVYLVDNGQGLDFDTTVHEFAHPFVRAIMNQNKPLFESILKQIINTQEGRDILDEVEKLGYPDHQILEEVAVRAITVLAKKNFNPETGNVFATAVAKLLRYLATLMKNVFGKQDLKISEIDPNFTLEQVADLFSLKPGAIVLEEKNSLIKPGVSELFESNPELANAVYEALGFGKFDKTYNYKTDIVNKFKADVETIINGMRNVSIADNEDYDIDLELKLAKQNNINHLKYVDKNKIAHYIFYNKEGETQAKEIYKLKDIYGTKEYQAQLGYLLQYDLEEVSKFTGIPTNKINKIITPQQKQQALQLYSQYLDTIFPDSKVKDIVYHGTTVKFDKFNKSNLPDSGIYFEKNKTTAYEYGNVLIPAVINSSGYYYGGNLNRLNSKQIRENGETGLTNGSGNIVFEPEQIHILGSKQDIERFKKFTESNQVAFNKKSTGAGEKKESRSQKEIYSMLNPEGKITKSDAGYVVLGETGYKRVTELVRKKFQLGNLEKSDAQVLGDLFHAHASNLIAAAFPEFNTHYKFIKLEGVPQETIININNIIKPIIEKAKKEGSVLVTELPIANTKKKIAGTIDVLEITKEGKVVMLDYKTSMNKGTVVGKYKKLAGNSQQQALYKSILAEDDPALGRESINVGYQSLMNIISYVNKAGKIQYKVQETVPVLYQNTLNKKRDEMLSILYDQIENLVGKINKDNRDKTNKLIEAKRELMVRIQKNAKDSEIIQTAAGDIAAIEAYISDNNDIDNYVEFRGDLELYRNLSSYVDVTLSKDKDALDFIQGKAARLFTELYDKSEKKISENIAKDLAIEGSPIQTAEDVMKPVRDINMYKSMAFGASYSNNPIVVGVYKKVMEKLGIVRKKSLQLADEIKKTVSDLEKYMGSVGESIYEPLLQYKDGERTGYVVDQFLPEYWNLRRKARTESDLKWFKENSEYDKEAYEKALANQKTYLESTKKARVASKIQYLKNKPEYAKNAAEKAEAFVDQEIKAEITKWVQNNNNIVQYNKPKEKWTDPKWKEIKQGKYKGTPVEKFYDLYINTMNGLEENALLPFDFRANFIADFRKSFLDRVINNGIGNMKLGKSIVDSLSVVVDEAEVNKVNPFTGEFIRRIPIAGRKVLNSQERKEFNKTEKSFDLGNSLAVFFESALRYKELSEIEKHIEISRDMLLRQKEQILNVKGEEAKGGFNLVKVSKGLDNTISQFNHFVDSAIYGKSTGNETGVEIEGNGITQALGLLEKGEKATISVSKFLDMFLKYTGLNNLGYNMYAPVTNLLGGKSMQFLQGVGGRWYSIKDYNFASIVVSAGPFSKASEDIEKANLFIEMLNPQVNEFMKDTFEDLKSENKAIKNVPGPFKAMQWSEDHMHKAGLIAMIKSNKHSVKWDEWTVENGKLVYKGEGKLEDSTMEAFRQKVLHVNGRALGNMNPDDKIMLKKWFLGRAIIQHRGWIPAMLQAHWSERQYDYQLGEYVEGRFNSLFKYLTSKKLNWNSLDEVEKANVKEAFAEFAIIAGAYLLYAALKSASDDDEDKKRLAYFLRISDRYLAEMTFFTPFEISGKHQILISPAPTISTFESWGRLISDVTTYLITSDVKEQEKIEKKLSKRFVRVVPSLSQPVRFIDEVLYEQTEEHK